MLNPHTFRFYQVPPKTAVWRIDPNGPASGWLVPARDAEKVIVEREMGR